MTHEVSLSRQFNASREKVYEAWTQPAFMRRWFCPEPDGCKLAATDLRIGGYYMVLMRVGDDHYPHFGEYKTLRPPEEIAFTWNSPAATNTLVTIRLEAQDGGTKLSLTHTGFENAEQCERHLGGWKGCLEQLGTSLS